MIIKVSDTIYLNFNPITKISQTIDLESLGSRKAELESELASLEKTDEELLAWAKQNFWSEQKMLEKEKTQKELDSINALLGEVNGN